MKKCLAFLLVLLFLPLYVHAAPAADEGTLRVACNMDGADVYVDGELFA